MRLIHIMSWSAVLAAMFLWGAFWFFDRELQNERFRYADVLATQAEEGVREEMLARLRSTVNDTVNDRADIEKLVSVRILDAVQIIEQSAQRAGATGVAIGEASPLPSTANAPKGIATYVIVVNAEGSFASVMRTISVFETLTIPATLTQFTLEKGEKTWRLTARLTLLISS